MKHPPNSHVTRKRLLILGAAIVLIIAALLVIWVIVTSPSRSQEGSRTDTRSNESRAADVEAEAKAFAVRFMDSFEQALITGDFKSVDTMYAEDCLTCKKLADEYSSLYRAGGRFEGDADYVDPTFWTARQPDGSVIVTVKGTAPAYKIVYPNGSSRDYPAKIQTSTFTIKKGSRGTLLIMEWVYD